MTRRFKEICFFKHKLQKNHEKTGTFSDLVRRSEIPHSPLFNSRWKSDRVQKSQFSVFKFSNFPFNFELFYHFSRHFHVPKTPNQWKSNQTKQQHSSNLCSLLLEKSEIKVSGKLILVGRLREQRVTEHIETLSLFIVICTFFF